MTKKKIGKKEKGVTLDDLAIMVNKGFQAVTDQVSGLEGRVNGIENNMKEMNDRIGNVEDGLEVMKEELHYGLKKVDGSIERVGRRLNHHEEEIIKVKNRVKVVERELNIESPR